MADKEIGDLTAAAALDGTELVHIVQSSNSRQTTAQAIADLGGGGGALDDLSDVTITSPSTDQVLKYDGSGWVNGTDATGGSSTFSGAKVGKTADQTGADYTTATNITFDAESFDTDSYHSTASDTDRLTVPSGVSYVSVTGNVIITSFTSDEYAVLTMRHFNSSGTQQNAWASQHDVGGLSLGRLNAASGAVNVSSGDYFTMELQVQTDTSVTILASGLSFSIHKLG